MSSSLLFLLLLLIRHCGLERKALNPFWSCLLIKSQSSCKVTSAREKGGRAEGKSLLIIQLGHNYWLPLGICRIWVELWSSGAEDHPGFEGASIKKIKNDCGKWRRKTPKYMVYFSFFLYNGYLSPGINISRPLVRSIPEGEQKGMYYKS